MRNSVGFDGYLFVGVLWAEVLDNHYARASKLLGKVEHAGLNSLEDQQTQQKTICVMQWYFLRTMCDVENMVICEVHPQIGAHDNRTN